jgi:hypothetical protein
MSRHVRGAHISEAWFRAYEALTQSSGHELMNLTVTVDNPGLEVPAVRQRIDRAVAELSAAGRAGFTRQPKSVHTVANTIFPISLYRAGRLDAFYSAVRTGQSRRAGSVTSWGSNSGTYIGRLVQFPTYDRGELNQLQRIIEVLNAGVRYRDRYELTLVCDPADGDPAMSGQISASASTFVAGYDNAARGGQCLSHISLNVTDGRLAMTALYRHQTFVERAYGNFLGLARLQHFLVSETTSDLQPGELMVVASHAEIEGSAAPQRDSLLESCRTHLADEPQPIECQSRPFGATWSDLELPRPADKH